MTTAIKEFLSNSLKHYQKIHSNQFLHNAIKGSVANNYLNTITSSFHSAKFHLAEPVARRCS